MRNAESYLIPQKIIRHYGTRDPFRLADSLGIQVKITNNLKQQKGFFNVVLNVSFIFINGNLSYEMQRIVCAHELGHALMHKALCVKRDGFLEYEIFDIKDNTEYEANAFASNLLIDEDEMIECFRNGYDVVQTARTLNINVNLLLIKLIEMKDRSGVPLNIPYIPRQNFLGTIADNAGTL